MSAGDPPAIAAPRGVPVWAYAAMVGSAACWGLATVLTKDILTTVPPFVTLATQLFASVSALWLAALLTGRHLGPGGLRAALSGLLEPGLAYAVGVPGLVLTTAASASIIAASEPAVVIVLGLAFFGQRRDDRLILVTFIAMVGVVLTTAAPPGGKAPSPLLGTALIFLGVVFAALYVLLSSTLVDRHDPLALAAAQQSVGLVLAILCLGAALLLGWERWPSGLDASTWGLVLLSGIVQYALAFWLYLTGMTRLPVTRAAVFLTLTPVFGVGGAMVFLGESLAASQALGCAMVIAALLLMSRGDSARGKV
jgi:drug/metabolite transporter (DMT)-like permease